MSRSNDGFEEQYLCKQSLNCRKLLQAAQRKRDLS